MVDIDYNNPLKLFFEDVSQLPILEGKRDYLPLTRRIRRGETLAVFRGDNPLTIYNELASCVLQKLKALEVLCHDIDRPPLQVKQVGAEIEMFLNDPSQTIPPALARSLGKPKRNFDETTEALEDLGWHCFYLLSLLPPEQRSTFPRLIYSDDAAKCLDLVKIEADDAMTRLTEGTLRYVINNAVNFVGQGVPFLDLVQEGVLGLQHAATKFDERKGHFQQYASIWIRQRIGRYITDYSNLIRVPVHVAEQIAKLEAQLEDNAVTPNLDALVGALIELSEDDDKDDDDLSARLQPKALKVQRNYLVATARHYSLERTRLAALEDDGVPLKFEDILALKGSMEAELETQSDPELVRLVLEKQRAHVNVSERDWEMLMLRLGFVDGEAYTLEEVGNRFGLTRERVRQIEARFLNTLKRTAKTKQAFEGCLNWRRHGDLTLLSTKLTAALTNPLYAPQAMFTVEEKDTIQHLVDCHIERGRPKVWDVQRLHGRKALFREVLLELGKPTHYSVIHEKALERVPGGLHFSKVVTYRLLFYGNRVFRSFGNAVFGLVEWPVEEATLAGEVILDRCPKPLLPPNAHTGAFFDSIEYGRQLLLGRALAAVEFWAEMLNWAGPRAAAETDPQSAFDAWYVVGLTERVRFGRTNSAKMVLAAPTEASLNDLRVHCLNALCHRVSKMPEWLLALATLGRPTLPAIQRALYGNENDSYDAQTRLRLLVALGAARQVDQEWRLTDNGRAVLSTFPELELPEALYMEDTDGDEDHMNLDELELDLFVVS